MAQLVGEYQAIEGRLAKLSYETRMAQLTLDQLPTLTDEKESKCYRSLGRAFVYTPLQEIKERLQRITVVKEDQTQLLERKAVLEKEILQKSKAKV